MDQLTFNFDVSSPPNPPTSELMTKPRPRARTETVLPSRALSPRADIVPVAKEALPAAVVPRPPREGSPSAAIFAAETGAPPATLAELMARLPTLEGLSNRRCREMVSAVRKVCRVAGKRPEEVLATPASLRAIFASTSPTAARVSRRRWNNMRCLALDALRRVGLPALQRRAHKPLSIAWEALRDHLPEVAFRAGLSRFMGWCSTTGIAPDSVSQAGFDAYAEALREGTARVDPKQMFRTTCVLWNRAAEEIDGWPKLLVRVPNHSRRYALDWDEFPESFRADVDAFLTRSQTQDPFADNYVKSVKPSTVDLRRKQIRQMATALANSGFDIGEITSLAVLVTPDNAKRLLRVLYARHHEKSVYLYHQATLLKTISCHWVRAPESGVAKVAEYATNLAVKRSFMTDKNRERLRQFDNAANVRALLNLPQNVVDKGRRKDAGKRADAVRVMLAVAVELLIVAPTRIDCLVGLESDRHLVEVRRGKTSVTHLLVPAAMTKTGVAMEIELPPETIRLLNLYRDLYRPRLAENPDASLFPNDAGVRRSTTAMSVAIKNFIKDETGLDMNVHLFRHLAVKLLLDAYPDDIETARRLLGHKSSATTTKAYAEFKTVAAFRRYDGVVARLRGASRDDVIPPRGAGRQR